MYKKSKRFASSFLQFALITMLVFTTFTPIHAQSLDYEPNHDEQHLLNQYNAIQEAEELFSSFFRSRSGQLEYPDFFGGVYIDSTGNLVTLITESFIDDIAAIPIVRLNMDNIRFVEFTYAELLNVFYTIFDILWVSDIIVTENIHSVGVDTMNNRINVYLYDNSSYQIERFRKMIVDHPSLIFKQALRLNHYDNLSEMHENEIIDEIPINPLSTNFNLGSVIFRRIVGGLVSSRQSIGYRATRNGANGFVTTMHGGVAVNSNFYETRWFGQPIGIVRAIDPVTDSAFVELINSASLSNMLVAGSLTNVGTTVWQNPVVGLSVTRVSEGGDSPISATGPIIYVNHMFFGEGGNLHITSLIDVASSAVGDSGGIAVISMPRRSHYVFGITIGASTEWIDGATRTRTAVVRADHINPRLGVQVQ